MLITDAFTPARESSDTKRNFATTVHGVASAVRRVTELAAGRYVRTKHAKAFFTCDSESFAVYADFQDKRHTQSPMANETS